MGSKSILEPLSSKIEACQSILNALEPKKSISEKISILKHLPFIQLFFTNHPQIQTLFEKLTEEDRFIILSLLAIRQEKLLIANNEAKNLLQEMATSLRAVESFYSFLGGIIGYHLISLV